MHSTNRAKRSLVHFSMISALLAAITLPADDAELLLGNWSMKKVNDQGQTVTQTVEVKKDRFAFQIVGADDHLTLYAEGDLKLEKLGPFKLARFSHVRTGESASKLEDLDDEYASIYVLDADTWTLANNFEKRREEKPSLEVYERIKAAAQTSTLIIDEIEMADTPQSATWFLCFEAKVENVSRRYYVENKGYEKNQVTIPVALELPMAREGQKCGFKLQLDDVDADVCTDEVDNQSQGEFIVTERGAQAYKPEDNWRYTIRWHLK